MKYAYLIYVDEIMNLNKFYEVTKFDDGSVKIQLGNVGDIPKEKIFPAGEKNFDELVRKKIEFGYSDVSALHAVKKNINNAKDFDYSFLPVQDVFIDNEVRYFMDRAKNFMASNYTVSAADITEKMIKEAENDLLQLYKYMEDAGESRDEAYINTIIKDFNESLKNLFSDIPRKMDNISDYLAYSTADFPSVIERESAYLETINLMYDAEKGKEKAPDVTQKGSVIDYYGIGMKYASYDDEDYVIDKLSVKTSKGVQLADSFAYALKTTVDKTESRFNKYCEEHGYTRENGKIDDLWHGTRAENMWSILKSGMSLKRENQQNSKTQGHAFGYGIYLANQSFKSAGYTSVNSSHFAHGTEDYGYLLLMKVAMGKPFDTEDVRDSRGKHIYYEWHKENLPQGTDCLYYHAGKHGNGHYYNNEIIVYDDSQVSVDYVVKFSNKELTPTFTIPPADRLKLDLSGGINCIEKCDDNTYMAEVDVSKLSRTAQDIIYDFITDDDSFIMLYDVKNDTVSLKENNEKLSHIITNEELYDGDYKWLGRQMKRLFADNEREWVNMIGKFPERLTPKDKAIEKTIDTNGKEI